MMGLDYGTKTVGVAISDALLLTAQGIETITRKEENKLRRTCARIEELIREYEVGKIVLDSHQRICRRMFLNIVAEIYRQISINR